MGGLSRRSFVKRLIVMLFAGVGGGLGLYSFLSTRRAEERRPASELVIRLPAPDTSGRVPVERAIAKRRSIRDYTDEPITLREVSQLLWAAQGITEPAYGFRTAPSAGATYPLEVYIVVKRGGVEGLEPGVYHHDPREHSLGLTVRGDFSRELMAAAVDQQWVGDAAMNIVFTAVFERTTERYGERGRHYVYMEAGHADENVYLQAEALNLGTTVIGAFYDEEVKRIVSAPREEVPLYIATVGRRR